MILRILVLALFFTACTSDTATEQDSATEDTSPTANQQQPVAPTPENAVEAQTQQQTNNKPGAIQTKNSVLESPEQVAVQIMTNFSRVITLRADQKQAMIELVSQYPLDVLEDKGKARTELRNKILDEIFDKEQIETWRQYQRKRNLEPVTIE